MTCEVIARHKENRRTWGAILGGGAAGGFGAVAGFLVGSQVTHEVLEVEVAGYSQDQYFKFRLKGSKSAYETMVRQIEAARMGGASMTGAFNEIVGEDLSGVTFVRDYLQLQFNAPALTVYMPTRVSCGGQTAWFGEPPFANLLIGQIGKYVAAVILIPEERLEIRFEDSSTSWLVF